jgi:hypothetical protein
MIFEVKFGKRGSWQRVPWWRVREILVGSKLAEQSDDWIRRQLETGVVLMAGRYEVRGAGGS